MAVAKHELPKHYRNGQWRRVPAYSNVKRRDVMEPCALCGWGRYMAIHDKPEGTPPTGTIGMHSWVGEGEKP